MIFDLCEPSSLPVDISKQLADLSKKGFRVLAVAYKSLHMLDQSQLMNIAQSELEAKHSVQFLGLVYFSSKLKPGTKEMFEHFDRANIRSSMITGDHIYTGMLLVPCISA